MAIQAQKLINEIEEIKSRLNSIESALIDIEEAEEGDREALEEALEERKKRKTIKIQHLVVNAFPLSNFEN